MLVTLLGNCSIFYIISRHMRINNCMSNQLVASLCLSEMLSVTLCLPLSFVSTLQQEWCFGPDMCILYSVLCGTFSLVSSQCILYSAVYQTRLFKGQSHKITLFLLGCIWGASFVISLPWPQFLSQERPLHCQQVSILICMFRSNSIAKYMQK